MQMAWLILQKDVVALAITLALHYLCTQNCNKVKIVLISILLVGICVMLLGVRVFFVKGGKFPNTHIHGNAALRKKGITCASEE